MILTKRQQDIILNLKKTNNWIKGSELANILNVTIRTIRNDIHIINSNKDIPYIISSRANGYKINDYYIEKNTSSSINTMSNEDRLIYIFTKLCINFPQKICIYELSEELFVSEFTIISDFTILKNTLNNFSNTNFAIAKESNYIFLLGNTSQLGKIFTSLIKSNINKSNIKLENYSFYNFDINSLIDKLPYFLKEVNFFSRYISFLDILLYCALILERTYNDINIDLNLTIDSTSDEFIFSSKLAIFLEKNFNVLISNFNKELLYIILDSCLTLEKKEIQIRKLNKHNDNLEMLLKNIFKEIYEIYLIDFNKYPEIIDDLLTHIRIAISRIENGFSLNNPLKEQLKNEYPFLFDIAFTIGSKLKESLDIDFDNDELCYIVAYLGLALNKVNNMKNLKESLKVVVIVLEGKAILSHIIKQLTDTYKNFDIQFLGISNINELINFNFKENSHLIISTTTLKHFGVNTNLLISESFNVVDQFNIKNIITPALLKIKDLNFELVFSHFFNRSFFKTNYYCKSKEDLLKNLCFDLEEQQIVDSSFLNSVIERENLLPTCINTGVALPHTTIAKSTKTCIYVVNLKKPLNWNGTKIKCVFLFAINKKDFNRLSIIYDYVINIVSSSESVDLLYKCKDFSEMKSLFYKQYINL